MRFYSQFRDVRAECLTCGWTCTAKNAQGLAAQHHDRTQHRVTVEINQNITYQTREDFDKMKASISK